MRARLFLVAATALGTAVAWAGPAAAQPSSAEVELAEKYAPVVRLQVQEEECGEGEPYEPTDVNALLPDEGVVLRGPWDRTNVVQVAPTAGDLDGRWEYHLDFPGDALEPGCTYELWSRRITAGAEPTVYAHVATEPGRPGKLALQYWFFYVFNDFNNLHEGDWEMIQLLFDADDAEEALGEEPTAIGYSQHEGAERAEWGDANLEIVDGTHPVVYPAAGSHANYYESALFLGRSAVQGVGCDDTTGPSRELRPAVAVVPSDTSAYLADYPWLGFEGRWGERQPAFYNGPTGPNLKTQWTMPVTWSEESWREASYAVPAGGSIGPNATQFFCEAIAAGSSLLTTVLRNGISVALVLLGLVLLLLWIASRTTWESSAPFRLARRRAWGQILAASWRMYRSHLRLFVSIGLLFVPTFLVVTLLQWLVFRVGLGKLVDAAGETNGFVVALVLGFGLIFTLLALTVVQQATARAMAELDAGRPVTALDAYKQLRGNLPRLLRALVIAIVVVVLLDLFVLGIPIAIWLVVRWSLLAQVVELEEKSGFQALARSSELVRGRWFRVATITLLVVGAGLLAGPLLGVALLLATDASFDVVNLVSSLVNVVVIPFVAIATTYLYHDLRVREEMEPEERRRTDVLPAEVEAS